ncbi:hypothetical protein IV203_025427 [Nitzschia inconspicua]|uniref:Uncharacterized protein n=1 Tax=Nitzschia inconspicua TaxID=303405 RepID=A0A9K3LI90_9STRA|nr:hypothetical protein IV203_028209 [Nitzschia inconspicua]KAG7362543.1 hypothetical protein IV203_025427 [Nitzschia inconspicua]
MVSVFNFSPVHALNVSFAKRTKNERFVAQSNLVDDNPKTHRIATTELFIDGEQATHEHVRQTVANLLVFLDTISHGASNSSLGQILLQISSLLGQSTTRTFFEKNTPKYPHLPHQVLLVIQDIFNTYVSMAVDTSNLRQVADPAGYIQHTVLHNMENKSVLHLSQLRAMFASSATSAFREPPTTWTAFSKDTRPTGSIPIKEAAGGAAPGKRTPVGSVRNNNSNKKKKSDDSVERKREALQKKGFLLYTGTSSRVTPIDLTFPVGTGRGRLCIGHCFRGRNCKNSISGTSCTYTHIDSLSNLSAEEKANLIAAVAATPTISWAPGCGPANTVHQLSSFATCIPPSLARPFIDSVTTHQPATQPIAVDSPPPPTSTAAQLTTASPLNITMEEDFAFPTKSSILANVLGKKDPVLSKQAPTSLKIHEREILVDTLEQSVQDALNSKYGKATIAVSFMSEYVFRHIIPPLLTSGFLHPNNLQQLFKASFLAEQFLQLQQHYKHIDHSTAIGYAPYRHYATETTFDQSRTSAVSAALFHVGFSVPKLIRLLGGPHLATHRDVDKIIRTLQDSVEPSILRELERIFRHGSPKQCNVTSTEANFLEFYRYGNHASAVDNPEQLKSVLAKDAKRGFTLVLDRRLLPFIRDLHLTPLGIVDLDNPWKSDRPVFDSSFRPKPWSMAINDWTNKDEEPQVQFPGSFVRLLHWIWNLRISYPTERILIGDNDITGAFRLIKYVPEAVPMHGYAASGYLGLATGQTFDDNSSPGNFEVAAIARQQHASFLWHHKPSEVLLRANEYVSNMRIQPVRPSSALQCFAGANYDSLNHGVFDSDGERLPPPFPHQVDDCMFADIPEYIRLTSAASIVALEDVFGPKHPCQESVLSVEKLDMEYGEDRLVVGQCPNTRRMVVELSPRRREKLLSYIETEGWLSPRHASMRQVATVMGMVDSTAEYFPWARAQLFPLHDRLRHAIKHAYTRAKADMRVKQKVDSLKRQLPRALKERFDSLHCRTMAEFVWRNSYRIRIDAECIAALHIIYDYAKGGFPWEQPIGHIVPRDPAIEAFHDASAEAIGVYIPTLRCWCFVPISQAMWNRTKLLSTHPAFVHINALEFIGGLLCYIIALTAVSTRPSQFPPTPILQTDCDNTSAIAWFRKMTTSSVIGQNLIRLFAEFMLLSPLGLRMDHLAGELNTKADIISYMSCGKRTRILESLPPKSRTLIAPSLDAVFQCEMGASDKTKQLGRVRAMRIHFIWFLRQHHLYGSFFPVNKLPLETLNYLMASDAAHLGTGHTLSARLVKVGTIKTYIAAAASLCMAFDDNSSGSDPRKMLGESNLSPPLKCVCDELKRWEDIPDRREPWTVALQLLFQTNAADADWSSKEAVLSDWFGVMQLAGGRRGEWAQDRGRGLITNPDLNARGDPAAFCLQDINFFALGKKKLTVAQALATPKAVETVLLKWRMQKNGDHGEEKQFSRNEDNPKLCVILKWINIVRRFVKFFGYKHNVPVAVYRHDDTNNLCYITSADIEDGMQRTAIELYELDTQRDKDDIKRFSAHSLRVGACVILQALGFQDHQIQQLLRWKSDKWRTYTRNLFIMTKKHNRAVFEASKMPNF